MVQQSEFTVHGPGVALDALPDAADLVARVDLPQASKPYFRTALSLLEVNRATLFPDLDNLAYYLGGKNYRTASPRESEAGVAAPTEGRAPDEVE